MERQARRAGKFLLARGVPTEADPRRTSRSHHAPGGKGFMQDRAKPQAELTGEEIRQRLVEITRARLAGRIDLVARHFAPDVVIHCSKYGIFLPGVIHGRDTFVANLKRAEEEFEALEGEILQILVEGPRNAVRWRTSWRNRGTGRVCALDMAYFVRWRDGLI